ncbi:MAG: chloride channel protein [Bacteroidia bacterium]|nr:MAG: chloride channel protein [Bacteroidia bacterium]
MHKPQVILRYALIKLRKYTNRYYLLIFSFIIGTLAGLGALSLKSGVFYLRRKLIFNKIFDYENLALLLYPIIGITLTVIFFRFIIHKNQRDDIPSILHAISAKKSLIPPYKIFSSLIGGLLTAGFGGSIGLESPIISSGSAIGSSTGKYLRLDYKSITILLACGAAGAMAAIFNTPIAGVVFAVEVLLIDLTGFTLIPLLLASVSGAVVTKIFFPDEILFNFKIEESFTIVDIPFYVLLGLIAGFVAVYFNKTYLYIIKKFKEIDKNRNRILLGALTLGVLIFLFPPLFGEGFNTIKTLLAGNLSHILDNTLVHKYKHHEFVIIPFLLLLIFLKVPATGATVGAGGIGGIFAPSLFLGAITGFLFAHIVNLLDIGFYISERNFALVGMAAMLAGVIHAPLTGIFLIAEITSGYELIVPLMIVAIISFLTVKSFSWDSIFTKELSESGQLLTHHKDKAVLHFMDLDSVIETDFLKVPPEMSLRKLTKTISKSRRNIFPVVNEKDELLGIITLDDIRDIMFDTEMYDKIRVENLRTLPLAIVKRGDTMSTVVQAFNETGAWNLPVTKDGKYIGFVSKSKLFEVYRKHLINISDD